MEKDLNENFRDITEENKKKEESKITSFDIVMGFIIGRFLQEENKISNTLIVKDF